MHFFFYGIKKNRTEQEDSCEELNHIAQSWHEIRN
jgi:hypothetical protein